MKPQPRRGAWDRYWTLGWRWPGSRCGWWACLCCLLPLLSPASPQTLVPKTYGEADGLPSNRVYQVLLDQEGMIWVATEQGVARFDGYQFQTFTTSDGLATNDVFEMWEDSQGRIWLNSHANEINVIQGERILSFPTLNDGPVNHLQGLYEDGEGSIWCTFSGATYRLDRQNNWEQIAIDTPRDSPFFRFNSEGPPQFFSRWGTLDASGELTRHPAPHDLSETWMARALPNGTFFLKVSLRGDTLMFVSPREQIFRLQPLKLFFPSTPRLKYVHIVPFIEGTYLLMTQKQTAVVDQRLQLTHEWDFLLPLSPISGIRDREGNYWIVTKGGGLSLIPPQALQLRQDPGMGPVSDVLSLDAERSLVSSLEGRLWLWEKGEKREIELVDEQGNRAISHLRQLGLDGQGQVFAGGDQGLIQLGSRDELRSGRIELKAASWDHRDSLNEVEGNWLKGAIKTFWVDAEGAVWFALPSRLYRLTPEQQVELRFPTRYLTRVQALVPGKGGIWFGGMNGLVYWNGNDQDQVVSWPWEEGVILALSTDLPNHLLVGTDGNGLWGLDIRTGRHARWPGTEDAIVRDIQVREGKIYLATHEGLKVLPLSPEKTDQIQVLRSEHGLPDNKLDRLHFRGDTLLMCGRGGLSWLALDQLSRQPNHPPIQITEILVNGKPPTTDHPRRFPHRQNQWEFRFLARSYLSQGQLHYRYRLRGHNEAWSTTVHREIAYAALPPGEYTFEVVAESVTGDQSLVPATWSFEIRPPWWTTGQAIGGGFVLLVLLSLGVLAWVRYRGRQKLQLHQQMAALKLEALQGRMNPHFIFNAMNAIQSFMLNNDTRLANRYLVQFGGLIRSYLDHADLRFLSLEEELEMLKKYIELSQLRMPDLFDFHLDISPRIDPETTLTPNFLLQPLVENAILHGLRNRKEKGNLYLRIREKGEGILIEVEDDGIGRAAAARIKQVRKQPRSHGLEIVRNQINTLNKLPGITLEMEILDLKDEHGNATGTRVDIWQTQLDA